jgi:hypothetical protein
VSLVVSHLALRQHAALQAQGLEACGDGRLGDAGVQRRGDAVQVSRPPAELLPQRRQPPVLMASKESG